MRGSFVKRNGGFQVIRVPQRRCPRLLGRIDAGPAVFPARVLFGLPRQRRMSLLLLLLDLAVAPHLLHACFYLVHQPQVIVVADDRS